MRTIYHIILTICLFQLVNIAEAKYHYSSELFYESHWDEGGNAGVGLYSSVISTFNTRQFQLEIYLDENKKPKFSSLMNWDSEGANYTVLTIPRKTVDGRTSDAGINRFFIEEQQVVTTPVVPGGINRFLGGVEENIVHRRSQLKKCLAVKQQRITLNKTNLSYISEIYGFDINSIDSSRNAILSTFDWSCVDSLALPVSLCTQSLKTTDKLNFGSNAFCSAIHPNSPKASLFSKLKNSRTQIIQKPGVLTRVFHRVVSAPFLLIAKVFTIL